MITPGNRRKVLLGSMTTQPVAPARIVVLARPDPARQIEAVLRQVGHEVYRTPDASGVASLVARIRPHLVIIARDIPWADEGDAPHRIARRLPQVPVLLIGEIDSSGHVQEIPELPSPIDPDALQVMVARLLGSSEG